MSVIVWLKHNYHSPGSLSVNACKRVLTDSEQEQKFQNEKTESSTVAKYTKVFFFLMRHFVTKAFLT